MRIALLPVAFLVLFAAPLGAAPGTKPVAVKLKTGRPLYGRVVEEECSDEQLVVREIRTGAKRRIPWGEIDETQAHELRVALGFEVEETAEDSLLIDGVGIVNRAGVRFEGVLENPDTAKRDGEYRLKTSDGVMRIKTTDVRSVTAIRLSALDVYQPLELYEKRRAEMEPLDSAEKHFLLGEYAMAVEALEQAQEHYEAALGYDDPKYTEAKLKRRLEMVKKLLGSKEARGELKEIKQAIHYKRFTKARELIDAFHTKYAGDEPLLAALAEYEEDLKTRRLDHYTAVIPKMVRDTVRDLLGEKAKEKELTLRDAQQYAGGEASAEGSVSREALEKTAEKLGLTPEETLDFWNRRSKNSLQRAFYRDGTFLVVENLRDALSKAPKPRRKQGGPKPPKPRKPTTPDEWWNSKAKSHKFSEMRDFLYAWWADHSGMVELIDPKDATCPVCAGKGYLMKIFQSSQGTIPWADRCPNCHQAGFHRVVRFR